jgi:hypothetical protein
MMHTRMAVMPKIDEQEAQQRLLQRKSFFHFGMKQATVHLKRIEIVYLPFYLFDMTFDEKIQDQIALDGILGDELLFADPSIETISTTEEPDFRFEVSPEKAEGIALHRMRWLFLERAIRKRKMPAKIRIAQTHEIFYPFWVGYFTRRKAYDFNVLDGVSGEKQGVRMRKVCLQAFRQTEIP